MEKLFKDIPLFVEAAKYKSFTKAAEALDMPLSTVSRRILHMEKALGLQLFLRGARSLELTEPGKALYERCRHLVAEAGAAVEELLQNVTNPQGPVRVAMSGDFYHTYMDGAVVRFARQWPDIELTIRFSDRWVDLYAEPFDLDIRMGVMPDSSLRVRRLMTVNPMLYAAPELLLRYPVPREPADLKGIPCLTMMQHGDTWDMIKGKRKETVNVRAAHSMNSVSVILQFTLAGLGVAWLVSPMVARYVESGQLVPILPGWTLPGAQINVIMASNQLPRRVRLFVDFLADHFSRLGVDGRA